MATGSCMCGGIEYAYEGEPETTSLCHCLDCKKWSGGPFSSNIIVPRINFKVTKGQPKDFDTTAASGKINKHWFCPRCGSSLWTKLEVLPNVTIIKSGGLNGPAADHEIAAEFFTKRRLEYAKPIEGAEQKLGFP